MNKTEAMINGNLPQVTHEGTIAVGGITIRVMTLDNGQRIIPEEDFKKALSLLSISKDDMKQILTKGQEAPTQLNLPHK